MLFDAQADSAELITIPSNRENINEEEDNNGDSFHLPPALSGVAATDSFPVLALKAALLQSIQQWITQQDALEAAETGGESVVNGGAIAPLPDEFAPESSEVTSDEGAAEEVVPVVELPQEELTEEVVVADNHIAVTIPPAASIPDMVDAAVDKLLIKFSDSVGDVTQALSAIFDQGDFVIDFIAEALDGVVSINLGDIALDAAMDALNASGLVDVMASDTMIQMDDPVVEEVTPIEAGLSSSDVESLDGEGLAANPNDTYFDQQYAHDNINVQEAWDVTMGSEDVIVAVIDSGIDTDHADLVNSMWVNEGEVAGDGIDNDGNGYVDDVNGWDFFNNTNDIEDTHGHGTMVAGVIAAEANNGIGVAGIAPNVKIMTLQVLNNSNQLWFSDAIEALDYAVQMGASVSNNSYGGFGFDGNFLNAIVQSQASNHVFVAAAGNNGINIDQSPVYPAAFTASNILSVAATDQNDQLAYFTNYGVNSVDLAAPGVANATTYKGGQYANFSGTSSAAPHVAAAVALVQSLHPEWGYAQVINAILDNTTSLSQLNGQVATGGLLNVAAAVEYAASQPMPDPVPAPEPDPAPTPDPVPDTGDDSGSGSSGDVIIGTPDDDVLNGGSGHDRIEARASDDVVNGGSGEDTLLGEEGNDTMDGGTGHDTLLGGDGHDSMHGGDTGADSLDGGAGNDIIYGGSNLDTLLGGGGEDTLYGGNDRDYLDGGSGHDTLYGDAGDDTLLGGETGADNLNGGDGNDSLDGGSNHDILHGGDGHDILMGGETGADTLFGDGGNDLLDGGSNHDTLDGGDGHDTLMGGSSGADLLIGGAGNDVLNGESNHDTMIGGVGADTLIGAVGQDYFVYLTENDSTHTEADVITDFAKGADKIDLSALSFSGIQAGAGAGNVLGFTQAGGVTTIRDAGDGFEILLTGTVNLTADDFIF